MVLCYNFSHLTTCHVLRSDVFVCCVLSHACTFHSDSSSHRPLVTKVLQVCLLLLSRMTSVKVNDENLAVCPPGKQHSSSHDIFTLDQPTGRPSILRQTENLPSKTVPKATKVENRLLVLSLKPNLFLKNFKYCCV